MKQLGSLRITRRKKNCIPRFPVKRHDEACYAIELTGGEKSAPFVFPFPFPSLLSGTQREPGYVSLATARAISYPSSVFRAAASQLYSAPTRSARPGVGPQESARSIASRMDATSPGSQ